MNKLFVLFIALIVTVPSAAHAGKKQAHISGANTDAHVSGANTAQNNNDDKVHASGATTAVTGKAAPVKKAGRNDPRHSPDGTQKLNDEHAAPGEVHKPREPEQATVEQPRSPTPPRTPNLPRDK